MQYLCPRTHFDLVLESRPHYVKAAIEHFSRLPDSDFAFSQLDIDDEAFEDLGMAELVKTARLLLKETPGYRPDMSGGEIIARLDPSMGEGLMGALHLEYFCVGNFGRFGQKTYFISRELTGPLAHVEPDVAVELLRLPTPCVQLVFDSQLMRDAVYAVQGNTAPSEGPVSVYALENSIEGNRILVIHAFHTDKRGIHGHAQRLVNLRGGGLGVALASGLANDPMFPFKGSSTSPRALLARIVANALLYLRSKDADITPGLRQPPEGTSAKELRRIQRSTTGLDYCLVGGWFQPSGKMGGRAWRVEGELELVLSR